MVIISSLHSVSNEPQNSLPVRDAQNREFQSLPSNGNSVEIEGSTKTNKLCQSSVSTALIIKLSSLIGVDPKEIKSTVPLSELGLDSFLALELQSWINSTFSASAEISDILDSLSLADLAVLVSKNGSKPKHEGPHRPQGHDGISKTQKLEPSKRTEPAFKRLPNLPLPRLENTLSTYLSSIEALASPSELANTKKIVANFLEPDSVGPKLQARLQARVDDPEIDGWLIDLYNESNFLDRNTALAPFSSFFSTHNLSKTQHRQAERATVITVAVRKYRELYKEGKVKPEQLNGQDTCMYSMQWLFGTHRMPCVGRDRMEKFEDEEEEYIVVMRLGRVFKVAIREEEEDVPYETLEATFEAILEKTEENDTSLVSILTADTRNSWAKVREIVKGASKQNAECLSVIERALFLICLDDSSPATPAERAYHFHFGDGSNRWWDKGMQFAVCSNGISGQLVEHAMLDAVTVYPLNVFMGKEIMTHSPSRSPPSKPAALKLKEYPFTTTSEIDAHIARVRKEYQESCTGYEHRFFDYAAFGASLAREKKMPPKSIFQMSVALASRTNFGYDLALWDGVSLASFYRGRVENNQVTLPSVVAFTTSTLDPSIPISTRRKLLFNAAKMHANSVTRAVRGRGVDRHMTSLRQMVRDKEPVPELFLDEVYQRSRPRKIMSHCHDTAMLEKGFGLRDPEAIWVHFEVGDERVKFSITGHGYGKAEAFEGELKKALETIRLLLVSE